MAGALMFAAGCASAMVTSAHAGQDARAVFLAAFERAVAARDAAKLLPLVDQSAWSANGHPPFAKLELWLPPAPLQRKNELAETELIYADAKQATWRLRVRMNSAGQWSAVPLDRPCPSREGYGGRGRAGGDAPAAPQPTTWTVFECWPLPR